MTSCGFCLPWCPGNFFLSTELSDEQVPGRWNVDSRQTAYQLKNSESLSSLFSCPEMMDENRKMININIKIGKGQITDLYNPKGNGMMNDDTEVGR